jgi:hypothetical protein
VTALGRVYAPGNTQSHSVKLVDASTLADVSGSTVTVTPSSGGVVGQITYAALSNTLTLPAGGSYYLVSHEVLNGDNYYDDSPVYGTATGISITNGVLSSDASPTSFSPFGGAAHSYGPVSLLTGASPNSGALTTQYDSLRNDLTGWVGASFTVGSAPATVGALGRIFVAGSTQSHVVKLVDASNGQDVPGATVTVTPSGAVANIVNYGMLPNSVTLAAGGTYYLLSQETSGGDQCYESAVGAGYLPQAVVNGGGYFSSENPTTWVPQGTDSIYGPVSLIFASSGSGGTGTGTSSGSSYSLSLDGKSNESTTLPNADPFNDLTSWRLEMRLHGITNVSANGPDQYLWVIYPSGITYALSLSSDGSTLKFGNWSENPIGSETNQYYCNAPLNAVTDILIRLQRNATAQNYQLQVWNTLTGAQIDSVGNCGILSAPTVSLSGALFVGGLGVPDDYTGGIAYLRIYNSAISDDNPPSGTAPGGELLDYEFENSSNLGLETGNSVPHYPLSPSGDPAQMPTPTGGTTPPSVSITAPAAGATVSGTVTVTATATATTPGTTISSVQLQLDGVNFGPLLTSSPFRFLEHGDCNQRHTHAHRLRHRLARSNHHSEHRCRNRRQHRTQQLLSLPGRQFRRIGHPAKFRPV